MSVIIWLLVVALVVKLWSDYRIAKKCKQDGDKIFWDMVKRKRAQEYMERDKNDDE